MSGTSKATPRPWPVWLNKSADGYWLVTAGPTQFASICVGGETVRRALDEAFKRQAEAQNVHDAMREALVTARNKIEDPWGIPARPIVLAKINAALAAAEGDAEDRAGYSGLTLDQRTEFNALSPHIDDRAGVDCGPRCAKCNYLRAVAAGRKPCADCDSGAPDIPPHDCPNSPGYLASRSEGWE